MQGMCIGQGTRWLGRKPVDQGSQEPCLEQIDLVDLGNAPGLELGTTRQRQIFEEPALEQAGDVLKLGCAHRRQLMLRYLLDLPQVEGNRLALQSDPIAVGHQDISSIDIHDLPNLREAPSQRSARIVGDVPEHPAKAFTRLRTIDDRQIGEQRTRFPRRRKGDTLAVAQDGKSAQHVEVKQRTR